MWRRALYLLPRRHFSSNPDLYSFLQPSIFALRRNPPSTPSPPLKPRNPVPTLTPDQQSILETVLQESLATNNTDEAWKSFKALTNSSSYPSKVLTNYVINHLSLINDTLNLKRAFASVVFLLEKNPNLLEHGTVKALLDSMRASNAVAPAFALVKTMLKNRYFVPFGVWGDALVELCQKNGSFSGFLGVFNESCRIALDEKLDFMKPSLAACNAALEGCCCDMESVSDAERVVKTMSLVGIRPDELSFGLLAYLYALKGLNGNISKLENLMDGFGIVSKRTYLKYLISGYLESGSTESVSGVILSNLGGDGEGSNFSDETFADIVKALMKKGTTKDVTKLIVEAQKLESSSVVTEHSVGYGIISACVSLGFLDKAHSILDEMHAQGCSVGLGVYLPILKAYCEKLRTAEATQLVIEISSSGLQLDAGMYDALIEASMSSQDFQSAFSLFKDMRQARIPDLKASYLTIMTGLTEHHRPELMASFLDEVVQDRRIEVGTHDWNSIIHAFCKSGRVEDANRTFRRMNFLQFEPNEQTYLSLINGYTTAADYYSVLLLWNEVKTKVSVDGEKGCKLNHNLVDAFLYSLVKGGFFDAVMQVVEKSQEVMIFVDKWRYKHAFMENRKKLKVSKLKRRNVKKMEALIAFKNWAGLSV